MNFSLIFLFDVDTVFIEMGNSQNGGYSGTLQSDRHSEGGQNVDTDALKKTLKVRIGIISVLEFELESR